ncbi:putative oxidoreductase [Lachnellula hyalina]|uniref:Putative oxidoreductase n=1 Tax=Lachnellula hyalina TaxID=1316788 RepID=A0A8H8R517_9HELO|nr:putative oxidoreductase [Lachnellula hyalina]TVY28171.1 putative oxidoreductase [Lachnellula hyalina]
MYTLPDSDSDSNKMEARASIPVSLPVPNPTTSYWQDPPSAIASHQSSELLPVDADVVIIGSGITGAAVAWGLLLERELGNGDGGGKGGGKIVMLEARGACSGATGRNGGHTKAASYRSFPSNVQTMGLAEASKIARMELANIRATHAFAKRHGIECEARSCDTVDVIYDEAEWKRCVEAVTLMREVFTQPGDSEGVARYQLWSAAEVREKFLVQGEGMRGEEVRGAVSYEAGSISAYAFVTGVLELCLERGLQLYTYTPALALTKAERGQGQGQGQDGSGHGNLEIKTAKGVLRARRVVLATNGYTAHLLPAFQGKIVPLRGQVTAHRPGSGLPVAGLDTTYSFIYEHGFEYMVPRPADSPFPGDIVIGGGLARAVDGGLGEFGETDDGGLNGEISAYLEETTRRYFGGEVWGVDGEEGRVRREWTGVMGYTADGCPFVGGVPGMDGVWIAAAFQGHGMVFCWESARALVGIMRGGEEEVEVGEWFPGGFGVTGERLAKVFEGRLF